MKPDHEAVKRAIEAFLAALDVPADPELIGTPERVAQAWTEELLSGYAMNPSQILSEATDSHAPGTVVVTGIALTTMCPHHLMPASGVAHVAYRPGARVVGFGGLARLVDCFSRRLTLQEDLGRNVADALVTHLHARAAGCIVDLVPTCLTSRSGRRHGARTLTHAWAGELADDAAFQHELLSSQESTP